MTLLQNLKKHHPDARHIDASLLLHFIADATKDWECDSYDCDTCPWNWCLTRMSDGKETHLCILEGIKDQAFIHLSPETEEEND